MCPYITQVDFILRVLTPLIKLWEVLCEGFFMFHERGWYKKLKYGQNLKLGDAPHGIPLDIQEDSSV